MQAYPDFVDHCLSAITSAEIDMDPWPHLIVNTVFPADFYAALVGNMPAHSAMPAFGRFRNLQWLVQKGVEFQAPPFWTMVRHALFGRLRSCLERDFEVASTSYGAELVSDVPGYSIGPHTDTNDKLITGLFYLPQNIDSAAQGTILYKCDTPDPLGKGHKFTDEFKPVKVVPYVPNSALFFERTNVSYHGVRPTPVPRQVLAFDLFWS